MQDPERYFLSAVEEMQQKLGRIPDVLVKSEPLGKVRVLFRNKVEPSINFGDWTVITFTSSDFANITQILDKTLADLNK
jgi:hypothetical protein